MTATTASGTAICCPTDHPVSTRRAVGIDLRPVLRRLWVLWMSVNDSPTQVTLDQLGVPSIRD